MDIALTLQERILAQTVKNILIPYQFYNEKHTRSQNQDNTRINFQKINGKKNDRMNSIIKGLKLWLCQRLLTIKKYPNRIFCLKLK